MATRQVDVAVSMFDACVSELPGEAAPKLALAFALECAGREAGHWYHAVWRTDHSYVSAAFGLARTGRLAVLDEVPPTSSYRVAAQVALAASAFRRSDLSTLTADDLVTAAGRLANLPDLDPGRRDRLNAELLSRALDWLRRNPAPRGAKLAEADFTETGLRRRLESIYRRLAVAAGSRQERHSFIDQANAVRPRTWL
jgi:serine/threonine-protein kinase PknG